MNSLDEGTAYFYRCKRCKVKFHEEYIILPDRLCKPCLKLTNYVCVLCESATAGCMPWNCANKWDECDECGNAYHEDRLTDGTCDRCLDRD